MRLWGPNENDVAISSLISRLISSPYIRSIKKKLQICSLTLSRIGLARFRIRSGECQTRASPALSYHVTPCGLRCHVTPVAIAGSRVARHPAKLKALRKRYLSKVVCEQHSIKCPRRKPFHLMKKEALHQGQEAEPNLLHFDRHASILIILTYPP